MLVVCGGVPLQLAPCGACSPHWTARAAPACALCRTSRQATANCYSFPTPPQPPPVQAPQPGTPFYITLRLYAPLDLALRDDYVPPPVLRAVPREGGSSPAPAASSPGPSSSSPGVRRLRARRT